MYQLLSQPVVASTVGLALLATFVAGNAALSFVAVPIILMPPAPGSTSENLDETNRQTPSKRSDANATASPEDLMTRQWRLLYNRGKASARQISVLAAGFLLYAALRMPESHVVSRRLHYMAIVSAVGVIPYTLIFMLPTNNELIQRAEQAETGMLSTDRGRGQKETTHTARGYHATASTHDLVLWWNTLNKFRAMLPAFGFSCVLAAIVLSTA